MRGIDVPAVSPCSHCVLAHGYVCKPFAHECWPIRTQCWPTGGRIRTKRWPTKGLVCKPTRSCSQAATGIPRVHRSWHYSEYDLFRVWVLRKKYVPFFVSTTATSISPGWSVMFAFSCGVTLRQIARQPWYVLNL